MSFKFLIIFILSSLFPVYSFGSVECNSHFATSNKFLISGRIVTINLIDLIDDVHGLFGQSHVVDINQSSFRGQLPAYFKDHKLARLSYSSDIQNLKLSGRLIEIADDEFVIEIFKVWASDPFSYLH